MAYYDVTAFAGTTLVSANVKQASMLDTKLALTRVWNLENGAKLDADGTDDADLLLGQVICRYQAIPSNNGMVSLDGYIVTLEGILGKRGTLTGKQYGTSTTTRTCTARCVAVEAVQYTTDDPPMSASTRQRAFVDITWEKLTEWA